MKAEDITIVICTYRRERLLEKCLVKLLDQSVKGFQTLVVDNASSKTCEAIAVKYQVSYVSEAEIGLSNARTRAVSESNTSILLYLDDDALPEKNLIKVTVKSFQNRDVAVVGGMFFHYFEEQPPKWIELVYSQPYRPVEMEGLVRLKEGDYLCGGIIAFQREVLIVAGGFNNNLGMKSGTFGYGEEDEIQDRLRELKYGIFFNSDMKMSHLVAPRKYLLSNQIKMAYSHGLAWRSLSVGHDISETYLIKRFLKAMLYSFPRSIAKVLVRKDYYWQNAVLEVIGPLVNLIGRYKGISYSTAPDKKNK